MSKITPKTSNGALAALGLIGAVAASGAIARRGSPALTSLTAPQGLRPAQPWRGIVGAARGGSSQAGWREAFERFPFELSIEIVESSREVDAWIKRTHRPGPGELRACLLAPEEGTSFSASVARTRMESPSEAFALYSPFTVAHRLFDATIADQRRMGRNKTALGNALASLVMDGYDEDGEQPTATEQVVEWAVDDTDGSDEDAREEQIEKALAQWASIKRAYGAAAGLFDTTPHEVRVLNEDIPIEVKKIMEKRDDVDEVPVSRVFASLACPTAAGRLIRLTDYGQAMAECYAAWATGARSPLVRFTAKDLANFSVEDQIKRWLSVASQKKATDRQIEKYRMNLERVVVPVLRLAKMRRPRLFMEAEKMNEALHAHREPLIKAANGVFSLQRLVIL